jgi:hypothetical protein
MFTMKRYGETWDNSCVNSSIFDQAVGGDADTSVTWKLIKSVELEGFHDKSRQPVKCARKVSH